MLPGESRHFGCWTQADTVSVWHCVFVTTNFVFVFSSCNPSKFTSSIRSSIISMVESEQRGKKKWQQWSLDRRSHHFLAKSSPRHKTRVKMSLPKLNLFFLLFLYTYLLTTQRKEKNGDGCTGEKTFHAEIYIMFQTHAFFVAVSVVLVLLFWGGIWPGKYPPPPPPPQLLSLFSNLTEHL